MRLSVVRYGVGARIQAIFHKIRHPKHEVLWRTNIDELCPGDITCETCNVVFWCRSIEMSNKKINEVVEHLKKGEQNK